MKRIVPVAAAALALTLSACGGQSNGAGGGDTTISFAFWGSNDEAATLKAMVAAFEKANPHIDVKENWIQSDYEQNLQVSIAGQKAPTVSEISNTSLAGFARAYDKADVDPTAYYSPNIPESMKLDGSYWAVPFTVKTKVMAVNGHVFDTAKVQTPPADAPMTTDQFAETARKLTSGEPPDKVYGSAPLWFQGWLTAMGGSFYDPTGKTCTLDDPVVAEAADFVIDAQSPDGYAPTPLDAEGQDMFDWLSIGRLGMQPDFGPWDIAKLAALKDPMIQIVPVPGDGEPMEIDGLGISKDASSDEAKAAHAFVDFMSTSPAAQDLLTSAKSSLGLPVVEASIASFNAAAPDLNLQAFVDAVDQSQIGASVAKDPQIRSDFGDALNSKTALGSGDEDPADVLPALNEQCQATLDSQ